jgi:hypothetical protein
MSAGSKRIAGSLNGLFDFNEPAHRGTLILNPATGQVIETTNSRRQAPKRRASSVLGNERGVPPALEKFLGIVLANLIVVRRTRIRSLPLDGIAAP